MDKEGKEKLVVLVDDNRYVHVQFERAVAGVDKDIKLVGFHSAGEAKEFLEDHKPATLFLDTLMPDRDGFTFLGSLRRSPLQQSTFTIMMASTDYAQNRCIARELGVVEFLIKPMPTEQIVRVIGEYVDRDNPY